MNTIALLIFLAGWFQPVVGNGEYSKNGVLCVAGVNEQGYCALQEPGTEVNAQGTLVLRPFCDGVWHMKSGCKAAPVVAPEAADVAPELLDAVDVIPEAADEVEPSWVESGQYSSIVFMLGLLLWALLHLLFWMRAEMDYEEGEGDEPIQNH